MAVMRAAELFPNLNAERRGCMHVYTCTCDNMHVYTCTCDNMRMYIYTRRACCCCYTCAQGIDDQPRGGGVAGEEEDEQTDVGAPIDAPEDLEVEVLGGKRKGKPKQVVDEEMIAASWIDWEAVAVAQK